MNCRRMDAQYQRDLAEARRYLVQKHGADYVADLEAWDACVREVAACGRAFTMGERERAEGEAQDNAPKYAHTTNEVAALYSAIQADDQYLAGLSDVELARAVSDTWEAGYYEHY